MGHRTVFDLGKTVFESSKAFSLPGEVSRRFCSASFEFLKVRALH
jgi:hypothetical protein